MLYRLYLDESGVPNPKDPVFPYFILSGVVIADDIAPKVRAWADRIKYKYWSESMPTSWQGVVFHSREIGRRENKFAILKNPTVEQAFYRDLTDFLNASGIRCVTVVVDKKAALGAGWDTGSVYKKGTDEIIRLFAEFLQSKNGQGQISIESAGAQKDLAFYKNYVQYLANGIPSLGLDHRATKRMLTSISFVTKNNLDIETQIADLLGYPAGYQCLVNGGVKKFIAGSYEEKMCQILQNKIIRIHGKQLFVQIP